MSAVFTSALSLGGEGVERVEWLGCRFRVYSLGMHPQVQLVRILSSARRADMDDVVGMTRYAAFDFGLGIRHIQIPIHFQRDASVVMLHAWRERKGKFYEEEIERFVAISNL